MTAFTTAFKQGAIESLGIWAFMIPFSYFTGIPLDWRTVLTMIAVQVAGGITRDAFGARE